MRSLFFFLLLIVIASGQKAKFDKKVTTLITTYLGTNEPKATDLVCNYLVNQSTWEQITDRLMANALYLVPSSKYLSAMGMLTTFSSIMYYCVTKGSARLDHVGPVTSKIRSYWGQSITLLPEGSQNRTAKKDLIGLVCVRRDRARTAWIQVGFPRPGYCTWIQVGNPFFLGSKLGKHTRVISDVPRNNSAAFKKILTAPYRKITNKMNTMTTAKKTTTQKTTQAYTIATAVLTKVLVQKMLNAAKATSTHATWNCALYS
ncbi:hypothetical protein PRIPAC_82977 [Pristionchus pacificus]|uniref:Uncharacterized protein n=1 Tax=Pristionchus pacificus TaxID=54126 RepID=A0A2A6BE59_PRIPA|nr:hypothetical protein PRIPAC_82977 [Pristionchus pacificus]|eukprot:PDM64169.1 hypothetical protein PRIPAC_54413 [Pristionchus pacificus]